MPNNTKQDHLKISSPTTQKQKLILWILSLAHHIEVTGATHYVTKEHRQYRHKSNKIL